MNRLTCFALAAFAFILVATGASQVEAGEKGFLYVAAHIDPETAANTPGAAGAVVYVYTTDGKKVSSGKGSGGWLLGGTIPLEAGDYWVAVGQEETPYNLHRYSVKAGETTLVPTGWVSVATLPEAQQPNQGCTTWLAQMRAYVYVDGKKHPVIDNIDRKPAEYGTLQLHPGEYLVEFHNFSTMVTVKSGQDYRLPTGFVGPITSVEGYLLVNRDDDPKRRGLPVCGDGAMHVLAGDYFLRETVRIDDGAKIDWSVEKLSVEPEGNYGYSTLEADAPGDARTSPGTRIDPSAATSLAHWGNQGGGFDDLEMFSDDPL